MYSVILNKVAYFRVSSENFNKIDFFHACNVIINTADYFHSLNMFFISILHQEM